MTDLKRSARAERRECRHALLAAASSMRSEEPYLCRDDHLILARGEKRFLRRGLVTLIARIPEDDFDPLQDGESADVVMQAFATMRGIGGRVLSIPVPVHVQGTQVTFRRPDHPPRRRERRQIRKLGLIWAEPPEIRELIAQIGIAEYLAPDAEDSR
jgi:hypothetical protein